MKMSFWRHCRSLVRRLQYTRPVARPRLRQPPSRMAETLENRMLLSSTPAMVADIAPGAAPSNPSSLVQIGSNVYFAANDGVHGTELWNSSGTAAGTVMVKDIAPGGFENHYGTAYVPNNSYPGNLTSVNGTLFFTANDGVHGRELWKSDGTAAGTVMVKDIAPGGVVNRDGTYVPNSSNPGNLTNVNGTLFFTANDGVHGDELWESDGTAAGTVMVKDINPGISDSTPTDLTSVNGTLFFAANDGVQGDELWKSDGTAAGTVMVTSINPDSASSSPANLTNVNGTLFFTADDGVHGDELWQSDGTPEGTRMVADINPGSNGSIPTDLTSVNGTLFFKANDGVHGDELWKSDGTAAGTTLVADIYPGGTWVKQSIGNYNYIYTYYTNSSNPNDLTNDNGTLFFTATDGHSSNELWKSNGTEAGTVLVADINPGDDSPSPANLTTVNGTPFFTANDGMHGAELWQSDGTATGTRMVADINPGNASSSPANLTNVNGTLFFTADDGVHGTELWSLSVSTTVDPLAVLNTNDSGPGSLRQVISYVNGFGGPGAQTITFDIPAGPQTINLLSPLPAANVPLIAQLDATQNVTVALSSASAWNNNNALTVTGAGSLAFSGGIEGPGNLTVDAGSSLTANHIVQGALVIGGTASSPSVVTIAASDSSGNALISAAVAASSNNSVSALSDSVVGDAGTETKFGQRLVAIRARRLAQQLAADPVLTAANDTSSGVALPAVVDSKPVQTAAAFQNGFSPKVGVSPAIFVHAMGLVEANVKSDAKSNVISGSLIAGVGENSYSIGPADLIVATSSAVSQTDSSPVQNAAAMRKILEADAVAAAFGPDNLEWLGSDPVSGPTYDSMDDMGGLRFADDLLETMGKNGQLRIERRSQTDEKPLDSRPTPTPGTALHPLRERAPVRRWQRLRLM